MPIENFLSIWHAHINNIPELEPFEDAGTSASYPCYFQTDQGSFIRYFYHLAEQTGTNTMHIGTPFALVTLHLDDFRLVELNKTGFDLPPFPAVEITLGNAERQTRRQLAARLITLYDALFQTYPKTPEPSIQREIYATLKQVVPEVLWPYYEILFTGTAVAKLAS